MAVAECIDVPFQVSTLLATAGEFVVERVFQSKIEFRSLQCKLELPDSWILHLKGLTIAV